MDIRHEISNHLGAFKVLLVNIAIVTGTTLADIDMMLKILASLLAISYTGWKFWTDYHKKKK